MLPQSSHIVSFYWNKLVEPQIPSFAFFQIRVEFYSRNISWCIVDEGASKSILSSSAWQDIGSPKLVLDTNQLLVFDRIPHEALGILPQWPIMVGGKVFLVDMNVMDGPLDFNMIIGHVYVYSMNIMVSMIFLDDAFSS